MSKTVYYDINGRLIPINREELKNLLRLFMLYYLENSISKDEFVSIDILNHHVDLLILSPDKND